MTQLVPFKTYSVPYDVALVFFLIAVHLSMIGLGIYLAIEKIWVGFYVVLGNIIVMTIIYAVTLPRRIEMYDTYMAVCVGWRYKVPYCSIVKVTPNFDICSSENAVAMKCKFATKLSKRVYLKRIEAMDVTVSVSDVDDFVATVRSRMAECGAYGTPLKV
eukprot:m.213189 g.213189  ORF g.213189 m.213189 type:complete len:160 (-) comp15082_c1_seq1:342-821(-)